MKAKLILGGALFVAAAVSATGCLDVIGYKERIADPAADGGASGTGATTVTGGSIDTGGTGTGGAGGASVCTPGDMQPCYDGADGTKDVGVCKGGVQTCNEQGTAFGACVGQVTPSQEDCSKLGNEACMGALGCSDPIFVEQFGPLDGQVNVRAVGVDASNGGFYIAGDFAAGFAFGSDNLLPAAGYDIFVAKLDEGGTPLWAKSFGATGSQYLYGGGVDSAGDVVITGQQVKSGDPPQLDFGDGAESDPVFVAKLDPSGAVLWSHFCAGSVVSYGRAAAADPQTGDVVAVGIYDWAPLDCGAGSMAHMGGKDIFVVKLDGASGQPLWSKEYAALGDQVVNAVAVDGQGNIVLGGSFKGTVNFGSGNAQASPQGSAFLVKLAGDGTAIWSFTFGDPNGFATIGSLAIDSLGEIALAGGFSNALGLGGPTLMADGAYDNFVAKLTGGAGHVWSTKAGSAVIAASVAFAPGGDVVLGGSFQGTLQLGGAAFGSAGNDDAFLAKMTSATGDVAWSKHIGGALSEQIIGIAPTPTGDTFVAGHFDDTFDLGTGQLSAPNNMRQIFVAAFAP